jgi:DNA-binding protein YbaB
MTAITINIPNHEVSFFKKMIEKMGWTYTIAGEESMTKNPRLYDPETGEYLNDKTMKAIEEAHDDMKQGRLKSYDSVDEMFQDLGIKV